jgi:hypothetical protein
MKTTTRKSRSLPLLPISGKIGGFPPEKRERPAKMEQLSTRSGRLAVVLPRQIASAWSGTNRLGVSLPPPGHG